MAARSRPSFQNPVQLQSDKSQVNGFPNDGGRNSHLRRDIFGAGAQTIVDLLSRSPVHFIQSQSVQFMVDLANSLSGVHRIDPQLISK